MAIGGTGGQGDPVNVTLGSGSFRQIGTGGGILAQSVGGAGGTAGNAIAYSGGPPPSRSAAPVR